MKTLALTLTVASAVFVGALRADVAPLRPVPKKPAYIEADIVAVNRGFGFLVANAGKNQGITTDMKVLILKDKKWLPGILKMGELGANETGLEYEKGKSDPRDVIRKVRFQRRDA